MEDIDRHVVAELDLHVARNDAIRVGHVLQAWRGEIVEPFLDAISPPKPVVDALLWNEAYVTRRLVSAVDWDAALETVDLGSAGGVSFDGSYDRPGEHGIAFLLQYVKRGADASRILLALNSRYAEQIDELQDSLVRMFKWAAAEVNAASGHIAYDSSLDRTAHEVAIGWPSRRMPDVRNVVRGYQWGTLLSKAHIDQLGGDEDVRRLAPVYRVDPVMRDGLFLQLTRRFTHVGDDELRRLKAYLMPLLVEPTDEVEPYFGPPVRVVYLPDEEPSEAIVDFKFDGMAIGSAASHLVAAAAAWMSAEPADTTKKGRQGAATPVPITYNAGIVSDPLLIVVHLGRAPTDDERNSLLHLAARQPLGEYRHIELIEVGDSEPSSGHAIRMVFDADSATDEDVEDLVQVLARFGEPVTSLTIGFDEATPLG